MFGFAPTSALAISTIYTIPKGTVVQAVTGVEAVAGAIGTVNGSAQIKIYEITGVQAECSLNMISDLYLMSQHRHLYARTQEAMSFAQGQQATTVRGGLSINFSVTGITGLGSVIAQGTFAYPDGIQATAELGTEFEGDRFDYWKKIKPTGDANWTQIVVPKPII